MTHPQPVPVDRFSDRVQEHFQEEILPYEYNLTQPLREQEKGFIEVFGGFFPSLLVPDVEKADNYAGN